MWELCHTSHEWNTVRTLTLIEMWWETCGRRFVIVAATGRHQWPFLPRKTKFPLIFIHLGLHTHTLWSATIDHTGVITWPQYPLNNTRHVWNQRSHAAQAAVIYTNTLLRVTPQVLLIQAHLHTSFLLYDTTVNTTYCQSCRRQKDFLICMQVLV